VPTYYGELTDILRQAGCYSVRTGKHEIWFSPVSGRTFPVPRSKSRHTANEVLKQAGLPKAF
jgi:hypothetical protein